jgi:phenylpyruvate tautomerase PptA (4-oxalocrotonate tautomerase family)
MPLVQVKPVEGNFDEEQQQAMVELLAELKALAATRPVW